MDSVMRNEQVKSALGTVKDKYTAAKMSVSGSNNDGTKDVDIAVRKATSHDDVVPKEKHVRTIKQARHFKAFRASSPSPHSHTHHETRIKYTAVSLFVDSIGLYSSTCRSALSMRLRCHGLCRPGW